MPESFKKHYPNIRMIIDATEFAVERPSLLSQSSTFSTIQEQKYGEGTYWHNAQWSYIFCVRLL